MARTRKAKQGKAPADPDLTDAGPAAPPAEEEVAAGESRPSQLDAIRAAISNAPAVPDEAAEVAETGEAAPQPAAEVPELPGPAAEPELPAHVDEPEAAASGAQTTATPEPEAEAEPEATPAPAAELEAVPAATAEATSGWVPPPAYPPPAAATSTRTMGPSSTLALGIVLVVVGVFFLIMRLLNVDLSSYGWPLFVIIPGLTLLIVGFLSLGTGALVPGGIVTIAGLVLAYQNATSDWASWAFAWTLVVPGGVGLGLFLQGLRVRDPKQLRTGRSLMLWSALGFMIGFVIFESIFQISGVDYGVVGRAALPVLLIVIGVTLLARSVQRGRSA